jgi:glycosyltransferase involved in cell wall biosynthesis
LDINLMCPVNDLGYGICGFNIFKELANQKHNISLFPIGPIQTEERYAQLITECINNQDTYNSKAPSLRIFHQNRLAESVGRGERIGFPIFELNQFTDVEKNHLTNCDKLFVCSEWAKKVVADNGIAVPTHVVPLAVDTKVFYPDINIVKYPETRFVNIGKWEDRKGHDILVEAFNTAFEPTDNVKLFMHCVNPFLRPEKGQIWEDLYKKSKLGDKIDISKNRGGPHDVIRELINNVDCCVFPSKAEGWNLELLEAMACGKHCILAIPNLSMNIIVI